MPTSCDVMDGRVETFLRELAPSRVLDIGAGAGKYGRMMRSMQLGGVLTAVEPHAPYVGQFALEKIYDTVEVMDAQAYFNARPNLFDVVIFGDVIEHMTYSAGIDTLHMAALRARYMVVVTPMGSYQHDAEVAWENHLSSWQPSDFNRWFPSRTHVEHQPGKYNMLFSILRGHWL